jgi:hypothetical protein
LQRGDKPRLHADRDPDVHSTIYDHGSTDFDRHRNGKRFPYVDAERHFVGQPDAFNHGQLDVHHRGYRHGHFDGCRHSHRFNHIHADGDANPNIFAKCVSFSIKHGHRISHAVHFSVDNVNAHGNWDGNFYNFMHVHVDAFVDPDVDLRLQPCAQFHPDA